MFAPPQELATEIFTVLPEPLRLTDRPSAWAAARGLKHVHSFLEGPAFDDEGHLFCVDLAHGRIFRIAPDGTWQVFAQYDGEPNGLRIAADGRIFVADHVRGILCFDPVTAESSVVLAQFRGAPFLGPNDLTFASNGDLYFTDPGESALNDACGRVFRLRADGEVDLLVERLPHPNGLVLNPAEDTLYVALTRSNQIMSVPLLAEHAGVGKCGVLLHLSGSIGPDGLALDATGNIAVAHSGFGTVWMFSPLGEPTFRIRSCAGLRTTNLALGGAERSTFYVTESESGSILRVNLPDRTGDR